MTFFLSLIVTFVLGGEEGGSHVFDNLGARWACDSIENRYIATPAKF